MSRMDFIVTKWSSKLSQIGVQSCHKMGFKVVTKWGSKLSQNEEQWITFLPLVQALRHRLMILPFDIFFFLMLKMESVERWRTCQWRRTAPKDHPVPLKTRLAKISRVGRWADLPTARPAPAPAPTPPARRLRRTRPAPARRSFCNNTRRLGASASPRGVRLPPQPPTWTRPTPCGTTRR